MGHRPPLVLAAVSAFVFQLAGATEVLAGNPPESPSFLSRHRQPLLVASGVGAGAAGLAAVFFRRAANDRFDDYRRTADPERLEELYDQAAELDNRAAASFIAAETLFVFAVYLGFFVDPQRNIAETGTDISSVPLGMDWHPERGLALRLQWRF